MRTVSQFAICDLRLLRIAPLWLIVIAGIPHCMRFTTHPLCESRHRSYIPFIAPPKLYRALQSSLHAWICTPSNGQHQVVRWQTENWIGRNNEQQNWKEKKKRWTFSCTPSRFQFSVVAAAAAAVLLLSVCYCILFCVENCTIFLKTNTHFIWDGYILNNKK